LDASAAAWQEATQRVEAILGMSGSLLLQAGIGLKDATAVFEAITKALAADQGLVLDIDWRLHPKDESVS
jgi:hypothetical protein